ncbi:hypothetical protein CLV63_109142 [Murinocardiopsis flavida]|uniref:Uncharacterized protein n=1 Tax=Murinocardiopsis flavida TaxID=645275 RepID=A0A2P8DIZ9_9ACTN|nr:hypothetical protein [Murinocardiopsis flavida]PSK97139.1 hypothetical protein CLV63_109142 [Murinocardiopsis flavida]
MRIYLPTTLPALAAALAAGRVEGDDGTPLRAYAATAALRGLVGDDDEALEYEAMRAAADASLRLLAADPAAPRRRVVLAADIPDTAIDPVHDADPADPGGPDDPAAVAVRGGVPLKRVASGHVDDDAAADDIAAGRTDDHELLWFATQELPYLVE